MINQDTELIFRIALGILFVAVWAIRLYFQKKVKAVERVSSRHERRENFSYRLVAFSFVPMLIYVFTPWLDFAHLPFPQWLRWIGVGVAVASTGLYWWAHQALGRNWSGLLEISRDHSLVTEGPYRSVRHPLYSAFFMFAIGILLLSANWLVGTACLAALIYMYLMRVSDEEEMMIERFGDSYRQYMRRTGRLLPRLGK